MSDQLSPREPRQPLLEQLRQKIEAGSVPVPESGCWLWVRIVEVDRIEDVDSHKPPVRNPPPQTEPGELL